jgi:hypothetical protein
MGWIFAGTEPRLVLGPHAGLSWRLENGLLFVAHDLVGILPPIGKGGVGVYNQTSAAVGYASKNVNFSLGPSLSIYSMPACNNTQVRDRSGRLTRAREHAGGIGDAVPDRGHRKRGPTCCSL